MPFLDGQAVEILERDRLVVGRVVDQDVQPPEACHHAIHQRLYLIPLRQLALERRRPHAVGLRKFGGHLFGMRRAPGVDHGDVDTLGRELVADALPEPPVAACHDCDCALEIHQLLSIAES